MLKIFCSPSRYVQGPEASRSLAQQMAHLGIAERPLVIVSDAVRKQLEPVLNESFAAASVGFDLIDFGGECSAAEIERCQRAAERNGAGSIVGAGGGKALDTARAVASALNLPVVCMPTIAASDAPCSALSVVYSPQGIFERCQFYKRNPDLVLVDTSVIARAPERYLVAGMGDALATWFEAETTQRACKPNQVGGADTRVAIAIARLCYDTLLADGAMALEAARQHVVTPALERIVEANVLLSGLGFESGGLAVAHAVHNGLTALPETHAFLHGEKVAFGTLVQLVLEGRDSQEINEVLGFCAAVGLPVTLAQLGLDHLSAERARIVAERSLVDGETSHNEPFALTTTAVMDALFAADAIGRAHQG